MVLAGQMNDQDGAGDGDQDDELAVLAEKCVGPDAAVAALPRVALGSATECAAKIVGAKAVRLSPTPTGRVWCTDPA